MDPMGTDYTKLTFKNEWNKVPALIAKTRHAKEILNQTLAFELNPKNSETNRSTINWDICNLHKPKFNREFYPWKEGCFRKTILQSFWTFWGFLPKFVEAKFAKLATSLKGDLPYLLLILASERWPCATCSFHWLYLRWKGPGSPQKKHGFGSSKIAKRLQTKDGVIFG